MEGLTVIVVVLTVLKYLKNSLFNIEKNKTLSGSCTIGDTMPGRSYNDKFDKAHMNACNIEIVKHQQW